MEGGGEFLGRDQKDVENITGHKKKKKRKTDRAEVRIGENGWRRSEKSKMLQKKKKFYFLLLNEPFFFFFRGTRFIKQKQKEKDVLAAPFCLKMSLQSILITSAVI